MTNLTAIWPIWFLIREATREKPITLAEIRESTGLSPRAIKGAVEQLRREGEPIGASRGKVAGYYAIKTADEADAYALTMWRQILSEIKTVKAMVSPTKYAEMVGQLRLDN